MGNLQDQIQKQIRDKRERSETTGESKRKDEKRLEEIRPRLDELAYAGDEYSLRLSYAVGPYEDEIAIVELYSRADVWVASWQVAEAVGSSVPKWEVTYNPRGVDTVKEWFRDSDRLFDYLTASIADRIVEMQADEA